MGEVAVILNQPAPERAFEQWTCPLVCLVEGLGVCDKKIVELAAWIAWLKDWSSLKDWTSLGIPFLLLKGPHAHEQVKVVASRE